MADRLRWGRDVTHPFQYDETLLGLRFLTRYRYPVVHQLAAEKAYCLSVLYLKASEYAHPDKKPFSNLFGVASRAVIQEFASMEEVAAMPFNELVEGIDQQGKRRFANPEDNANTIFVLIVVPAEDAVVEAQEDALHRAEVQYFLAQTTLWLALGFSRGVDPIQAVGHILGQEFHRHQT